MCEKQPQSMTWITNVRTNQTINKILKMTTTNHEVNVVALL